MKWLGVMGIIVIAVLFSLFELPKVNKDQQKEKRTFIILTVIASALGILLVFFPTMPGPTQLVEWIFRPLGKLMEK